MIRKAVIPAAGLGTRFLPVTKTQPKEMLPIVDKPTIQYVVEEAVQSGITDILIITGRGKQSIESYFDRHIELENHLEEKGRGHELRQVRELVSLANIHFIRQAELNGLGDAVSYARWHVGDEPFVVLLGDTLVDSCVPCTRQLIDVYNQFAGPVLGVEQVPPEKAHRYGIIGGAALGANAYRVDTLVEKPEAKDAPSDLAIAGRYILTPDIFDCIDQTPRGLGNEIQLTDALRLLRKKREIYACKYDGIRHDIGNRLDYMKTAVKYASNREDIGEEFRKYLRQFVSSMDE